MYKPCGESCEGCEIRLSNCHHIYSQAEARELGSLAWKFCHLPENTVQICLPMHEELEATYGWPEFPSITEMKEAVYGRSRTN
jgi:hypothetical protein